VSYFIVIFLGLIATLLILAPLVTRLTLDVAHLAACLKQAQQDVAETRKQAEYYRLACEHAPDGILIQDMSGRIIWSNPAYSRIHGHAAEDIRGRNPLEFALAPSRTPPAEEVAAFRYDPNDAAYERLQLYENVRADGTPFWNQISVSFHRSADGQENAVLRRARRHSSY